MFSMNVIELTKSVNKSSLGMWGNALLWMSYKHTNESWERWTLDLITYQYQQKVLYTNEKCTPTLTNSTSCFRDKNTTHHITSQVQTRSNCSIAINNTVQWNMAGNNQTLASLKYSIYSACPSKATWCTLPLGTTKTGLLICLHARKE